MNTIRSGLETKVVDSIIKNVKCCSVHYKLAARIKSKVDTVAEEFIASSLLNEREENYHWGELTFVCKIDEIKKN